MFPSLQKTWKGLTLAQKITLVVVPLVMLCGIGAVISIAGRPSYGVLFSNLSPEDAGAVTSKLKELKTDYRLADEGKAIEVPDEKVYDLRLSMASEGLPRGGSVGFELFDKTSLGATDFTQHLNYQRALQGELTRTINRLQGVADSRVHVVIPEHRLFSDKQEPSTASVVLQLKPGYQPTEREVAGIVHLVASAVEGLKPENVSVLDDHGNSLSTSGGGAPELTDGQLQMQERYEKRMGDELQRLADQVLGTGKSAIRVSAELNWDQTETTSESYGPSGLSGKNLATEEQTNTEKYTRTPGANGGTPGVLTNTAGTGAAAGQEPGMYENQQTTGKFVVNKVVKHIISAPGNVRRISVAVLMDGAITPAQQEALKNVFAAGAGLDTLALASGGRGDRIELLPMSFDHGAEAQAAKLADAETKHRFQSDLMRNIAAGVVVLIVSVASLVLFRRMRAPQYKPFEAVVMDAPSPAALMAAEEETKAIAELTAGPVQEEPPSISVVDRVRRLAEERPEEVAQQLRTWLAES